MSTNDPTIREMRAALHERFSSEWLDDPEQMLWDTEAAVYWFAADYHGGQSSNLYAALSASDYDPGPLLKSIENEDDGARECYAFLVEQFA